MFHFYEISALDRSQDLLHEADEYRRRMHFADGGARARGGAVSAARRGAGSALARLGKRLAAEA